MTKHRVLMVLKLLSWIGLIVLFIGVSISAIQQRKDAKCDMMMVRFKNDHNLGFIQSSDVVKEVTEANPSWSGQHLSQIKFNLVENAVKQNQYVRRAEIFLDDKQQMNVIVEPKLPIARIHSTYGDYYLSEDWDKMALNENYSKRIVHISGRIERLLTPRSNVDSFINLELKTLFQYMDRNPVWRDAIDLIYITQDAKIELSLSFCQPMIILGRLDETFEKRMEKLDNFFRMAPRYQNISQYRELDFQYSNQVVARKKNIEISNTQ